MVMKLTANAVIRDMKIFSNPEHIQFFPPSRLEPLIRIPNFITRWKQKTKMRSNKTDGRLG